MNTHLKPAKTTAQRHRAKVALRSKDTKVLSMHADLYVRKLYHELQSYKIELYQQKEAHQCTLNALQAAERQHAALNQLIEQQYKSTTHNATHHSAANESVKPCQHQATITQLQTGIASLTPREQEVLRQLVAGQCTKTVARHLNISPRTIEIHRFNILKKLNFTSYYELLVSPTKCLLEREAATPG